MPVDRQLLSRVPLFEALDDEERELLAQNLDEVQFDPGQMVFHRGDPGDALFIVSSGEIETYLEAMNGQRISFEKIKPGDFFGEMSLLDGESRSASAVALQNTTALKVDRDDLRLLFRAHPEAAMQVLAAIGRRLREADQILGRIAPESPNEVVEERITTVQRIADKAADFSGSFKFLAVHLIWFTVWISVNAEWVKWIKPFDPYPYGLLTMIVSLEAIFLSCMVLISQNRQAAKERIRSDVEFEANIRAGQEVTQLHVKIDNLYEQTQARLAHVEACLVTQKNV